MKFRLLTLLTFFVLFAGNGIAAVPEGALVDDPYRLDPNVQPTFQQLTLNIDPAQTEYDGSTRIEMSITVATETIRLHARDMDISSLTLTRGDESIAVNHESGDEGLLILTGEDEFASGKYTLNIVFNNNFETDGIGINRTEHGGDGYIFSQFEAIDARKAFPCFDEPGYKYPWQMTMTVPSNVTAVTNTPINSVTESEGQTTTVFKSTPPLPSYLIAVAVGPFEFVDIPGMSIPGRVVTPRGKTALAKVAVESTPPLLASLEKYFGQPYPYAKLDLIATFQGFSGAMEHPGAITYSDFLLLLDDTASEAQKIGLKRITAHELAHQWFGNLVTMTWWNDLWLNESFADWMGDKTVEDVYPEASGDLTQLRTIFAVMDADSRTTTKPIRHEFRSNDNFTDGVFLSYYKGKSVLNMFERSIGEEVFREGVVRYLRKYSRKNAAARDFWENLGIGADYDFAAALATFIDLPGVPLVNINRLGNGQFEFTQSRYVVGSLDLGNTPWVIPLTYKYRVGDDIHEGGLLLDSASKTITIEGDVKWILPNANQQGYFRWLVPNDMLLALSGDASANFTVRERMGLVSNLWALLTAEKIDGGSFVGTIKALSTEVDPSVLDAINDQLGNIYETFVTSDLKPDFAQYIQAVLGPTLDRIGTAEIVGESSAQAMLRPKVLDRMADIGKDEAARTHVSNFVKQFLAGEIPSSALVERSLQIQARLGDQALYEQYLEMLEAASTPGERRRYLRAIGSFRDPAIVDQVLAFVLSGELNAIDVSTIIQSLTQQTVNHEQVTAWLMANDTLLRERMPEGAMSRIPFFITSCDEAPLAQIRAFYADPSRHAAGIDTSLNNSEAAVKNCAALRAREQTAVAEYLGAK